MTVEKRVRFKSWWLPWVLVAPQMAIVLVFFFWPAGQALFQSVLREDAFGTSSEFVGLLNFRRLSRAQDGNVAAQLASNLHLNRSFSVSQQVDDAIASLTLEQVNAAWRAYIKPDSLVVAWAGDFKAP